MEEDDALSPDEVVRKLLLWWSCIIYMWKRKPIGTVSCEMAPAW
jgi:hypothetical protein